MSSVEDASYLEILSRKCFECLGEGAVLTCGCGRALCSSSLDRHTKRECGSEPQVEPGPKYACLCVLMGAVPTGVCCGKMVCSRCAVFHIGVGHSKKQPTITDTLSKVPRGTATALLSLFMGQTEVAMGEAAEAKARVAAMEEELERKMELVENMGRNHNSLCSKYRDLAEDFEELKKKMAEMKSAALKGDERAMDREKQPTSN